MNTTNSEKLRDRLCFATAVAVGLFTGIVDFHNNEPQAAASILLVFCAMMGFARPAHAWRWGVIAPLGIPAVSSFGRQFGFKTADAIHPNIFASLIALVPGLIGAYGGALLRLAFAGARG